jgi:hypothetical protein
MKLIFGILAAALVSTANANTVAYFDGAQAQQIIQDLELTPDTPAQVHLAGYVTERAHPPVLYTDLSVNIGGKISTPSLSNEEKTALGELFENAGLNPAVVAGGTTYSVFDLAVECTADSCTVH